MSKYRAVIFDLGGTLMASTLMPVIVASARRVADAIAAPPEEFTRRWVQTYEAVARGACTTVRANIVEVCRQLGMQPTRKVLDAAATSALKESRRRVGHARPGAIEVLSSLKSRGLKTGLLTSCGPDVPEVWLDTPYARFIDVPVFSCLEGVNKEDPRLFWLTAHRLRTTPEECVYVADGYRGELANATMLGMRAVQLSVSGEGDKGKSHDLWDGPVISSLLDVLTLLRKGRQEGRSSS